MMVDTDASDATFLAGSTGLATVMTRLQAVDVATDDVIYRTGEPGGRMFIVDTGRVKIGRLAPDGREHLFTIAGPSDVFGEDSVIDVVPRGATATALCDTRLRVMDRATLRKCLLAYPEVADHLLRVLARRVRRGIAAVVEVTSADASARIAGEILTLAQQFGTPDSGSVHVEHGLTQTEMAQLAGTSRETVSKVLGEFGRRGWIHIDTAGTLTIDDSEQLTRRRDAGVAVPPTVRTSA